MISLLTVIPKSLSKERKQKKNICVRSLGVLTLLEGMVDIQKGQVVSIHVGKPHLGLVCSLLGLGGSHKTLRHYKRVGRGNRSSRSPGR